MKKQRQSKTALVDKGSTETLTDKSAEQTTVRKGKKIAEKSPHLIIVLSARRKDSCKSKYFYKHNVFVELFVD